MTIDRLGLMRALVRDGYYGVAFTSDNNRQNVAMSSLATASELDRLVDSAKLGGRQLLGVVALTPDGPRVLLNEDLTVEEIAPLAAVYIAHVAETFTAALQHIPAPTQALQYPVN